MRPFDADHLIGDAVSKTGCSDFGEGPFDEDFRRFIRALNDGGTILDERWDKAYEYLLKLLVNRLYLFADLKRHPEIHEIELQPPVVILSLPRTGTTKLQRLLGTSGSFQNLLYWHTHMFGRIPGEPGGGVQQRINATRSFEQWCIATVPDYHLSHPMYTDEPEEDVQIMNSTFRSMFLPAIFDTPEYNQWLATADPAPSFDYLKLVLKYLQWQFYADQPKGWFLKSPGHFGFEAQYQRVFGKATKFICTHRDLSEVIPSLTRSGEILAETFSRPRIREGYGVALLQQFSAQANTHLRWRAAQDDTAILDLAYKDIRDDSIATAEKVYAFLGLTLDDSTRLQIGHWDQSNPLHKHGKSVSQLSDWGLTKEMIGTAFANYDRRYANYLRQR